jgi:hypothetical protein
MRYYATKELMDVFPGLEKLVSGLTRWSGKLECIDGDQDDVEKHEEKDV